MHGVADCQDGSNRVVFHKLGECLGLAPSAKPPRLNPAATCILPSQSDKEVPVHGSSLLYQTLQTAICRKAQLVKLPPLEASHTQNQFRRAALPPEINTEYLAFLPSGKNENAVCLLRRCANVQIVIKPAEKRIYHAHRAQAWQLCHVGGIQPKWRSSFKRFRESMSFGLLSWSHLINSQADGRHLRAVIQHNC